MHTGHKGFSFSSIQLSLVFLAFHSLCKLDDCKLHYSGFHSLSSLSLLCVINAPSFFVCRFQIRLASPLLYSSRINVCQMHLRGFLLFFSNLPHAGNEYAKCDSIRKADRCVNTLPLLERRRNGDRLIIASIVGVAFVPKSFEQKNLNLK